MSDSTLAYQLQVHFGDAANTVPDAWRFDPPGCQGMAQVVINHIAPPAIYKACPTFQDAGGGRSSLQIKDLSFSPPALPYPTTLLRISLVDGYPGDSKPGSGNKPKPNVAYFLMDVEFNHQYSGIGVVNPPQASGEVPPQVCRGVEAAMCFHLTSASHLLNDGTDREAPWPISQEFITANDRGNALRCAGAVPAVPATWGSIKARYSR